jgi:heptose I phosphotransferase
LTHFDLETHDSGQLIINGAFSDLLRRHEWLTFDTIWSRTADAAIAKKMRTDRITLRFTLDDGGNERAFYIKRHGRSSWKEYLKPLLRLTWPILGARNEWNAILEFHAIELPTMTPIAFGESGSNSFLITEALENCEKLSKLNREGDGPAPLNPSVRSGLLREVARLTRKMHEAGLHHQDYYLGHLLRSQADPKQLYIIDLGRVRKQRKLSRRWIVKDLAQLDFSADASPWERLRFLREYLGRPLTVDDRRLMSSIQSKKATIARHSHKNRL